MAIIYLCKKNKNNFEIYLLNSEGITNYKVTCRESDSKRD